jgi:transcriptional regulator with XRE-family HTH domain
VLRHPRCGDSGACNQSHDPGLELVYVSALSTALGTGLRKVHTVPTPREQLAIVLKQSRLDGGFASHGALAKRLNVSRPVVSKAENPLHPVPSDALLAAWAGATGAAVEAFTDLAKRSKSGTPDWFVPYVHAESEAKTIRCWAPMVVPGLAQCESYARGVLSAEPYSPERLAELVTARMQRQRVLDRAYIVAVLDSGVLKRFIGSAAVMAEQCGYLVRLAERPNVSVHVVPEGTNTGAWAALDIATRGGVSTVCLTTALEDVTTSAADQVDSAMQTFERILGSAMPCEGSIDFIRSREEEWKAQI